MEETKDVIIFDAIHGNIRIPPLCRLIIDTPQFDRYFKMGNLIICNFRQIAMDKTIRIDTLCLSQCQTHKVIFTAC